MLHGYFHIHLFLCSLTVDYIFIKGLLPLVQIGDKLLDSALVVECLFLLLFPVVPKNNLKSFCQKGRLLKPYPQCIVIIYSFLKDLFIRKEINLCPVFIRITISHNLKRGYNLSPLITLMVLFSVGIDGNFQPFRQRIYHRSSHSVKPSGDLIPSASEFASRMKDCKHNLHSRKPGLFLDSHRDSPAVVHNRNGIILIYLHINLAAIPCQSFVYGIIHDLIYQMVKSSG